MQAQPQTRWQTSLFKGSKKELTFNWPLQRLLSFDWVLPPLMPEKKKEKRKKKPYYFLDAFLPSCTPHALLANEGLFSLCSDMSGFCIGCGC